MDIVIPILFLLGFVVLIKSADVLVDGASALARRLNISEPVIGLTTIIASVKQIAGNGFIAGAKSMFRLTQSRS